MDALPVEMLRAIGSFLDHQAYSCLRLTCVRLRSSLDFKNCSHTFWKEALAAFVGYKGSLDLHLTEALFCISIGQFMGKVACSRFEAHPFQANRCINCKLMQLDHVTKPRVSIDWRGQSKGYVHQKTARMPFASSHSLFENLRWTCRFAKFIVPEVESEYKRLQKSGWFDRLECEIVGPLNIDGDKEIAAFDMYIGIYGDNFGVDHAFHVPACPLIDLSNL
jgi:hypothetical protein